VTIIAIMGVLIFVIDFGSFMALSAQMAIMEQLICDDYYGKPGFDYGTNGTLGDALCKTEPVQSELALLNGWSETFSHVPGN
jgi:hypothetical protein